MSVRSATPLSILLSPSRLLRKSGGGILNNREAYLEKFIPHCPEFLVTHSRFDVAEMICNLKLKT